jgi:hypothetical protein
MSKAHMSIPKGGSDRRLGSFVLKPRKMTWWEEGQSLSAPLVEWVRGCRWHQKGSETFVNFTQLSKLLEDVLLLPCLPGYIIEAADLQRS